MADLSTSYMGIELKNPVVVAACALSNKVDNISRAEEAGAGALVIRSLFEEQIRHEIGDFDDALSAGGDAYSEATSFFPEIEHGEAKEHLFWVERAREATKMPLIASLTAASPGKWVEYAKQLADTGVNGLELNYSSVEADINRSASERVPNRFHSLWLMAASSSCFKLSRSCVISSSVQVVIFTPHPIQSTTFKPSGRLS